MEDVKMSCKCDTINIVNDNNVIVVSHADGRDGKSAYQQAVEGGYTGTEQEFNCSLSLLADVKQVKENLVSSIEYKGGTSNADKSFQGIAQDIKEIPNFPTTGFEYISEIYRPRTLMEAYNSRYYLKSIVNNTIEGISGYYTFSECYKLQSVHLPNLTVISGYYTFYSCSLQSVQLPNLTVISGAHTFYSCSSLKSVQFGSLGLCADPFSNNKPNLRNITIQDADINLPFQQWTATSVIAEGQSGIDELNNNLRTNLLEKLADHSTDGQTRTLRLGWLAHVSQENIDYANSKGWTLTT